MVPFLIHALMLQGGGVQLVQSRVSIASQPRCHFVIPSSALQAGGAGGALLLSAWAVQEVTLANLYTSVHSNSLPFITSWGALLISLAAWVNMGLL